MEFFATCGTGMEKVLGSELKAAGVHGVRPLSGGVNFHGEAQDAYKALLWSRLASRVLLNLSRTPASNADELYEGAKDIPWEDHIPAGGTIAVDARGTSSQLRDTRFTALRVKDAVCDRLRELRGERPDVDSRNPSVRINVALHNNKATISIDLSGASLDRRGYASAGKPQGAPIRENLAAGMLLLADWQQKASAGAGLLNPYSGPGTLAIEAAMIAADVAPQIYRSTWGFEEWLGHEEAAWLRLLDKADERAEAARERGIAAPIVAWDEDAHALEYAKACAKKAGVTEYIIFAESQSRVPSLASLGASQGGLLACNLSGDGRFASMAQLPTLYASLGSLARSNGVAQAALLAADPGLDAALGMEMRQELSVRNGANDASLRIYAAPAANGASDDESNSVAGAAAGGAVITVRDKKLMVADAGVEQFASRLAKMAKQRRKWAKKERVYAYRVYDADLPEYNLAIDLYNGAGEDEGKTLVHVAEYAAPKKIDPAKTARRLADALTVVPVVLDVSSSDVFVKQRLRAKGGSQYARSGSEPQTDQGRTLITRENGLFFQVDLADRLDTGLFLDHRDTRKLLRQLVPGKSFLNLFAYTGSASVYAAAGGAKFTTTVDLSNTYQEWSRLNMSLNGFDGPDHHFERADVLAWVQEKRHTKERWDLIFVDPPTFSNSAKMGKRTWDVQEDHAELLIGVSRLLTRTGAIVFSCNLRGFEPDVEALAKAGVVINDITARTIPEDFARNPKVHHTYVLRRG